MKKNEEVAQEICVEVWERGCLSNRRIREILDRAYPPTSDEQAALTEAGEGEK